MSSQFNRSKSAQTMCELCGIRPATKKLTDEKYPAFRRDVCESCGNKTVEIHNKRPPAGVG